MQYTSYYSLPQYEANDKTAWLTIFNQAMLSIDTGMELKPPLILLTLQLQPLRVPLLRLLQTYQLLAILLILLSELSILLLLLSVMVLRQPQIRLS